MPLSRNLGTLTSWNPLGPLQACNGTDLPLPLTLHKGDDDETAAADDDDDTAIAVITVTQ